MNLLSISNEIYIIIRIFLRYQHLALRGEFVDCVVSGALWLGLWSRNFPIYVNCNIFVFCLSRFKSGTEYTPLDFWYSFTSTNSSLPRGHVFGKSWAGAGLENIIESWKINIIFFQTKKLENIIEFIILSSSSKSFHQKCN